MENALYQFCFRISHNFLLIDTFSSFFTHPKNQVSAGYLLRQAQYQSGYLIRNGIRATSHLKEL